LDVRILTRGKSRKWASSAHNRLRTVFSGSIVVVIVDVAVVAFIVVIIIDFAVDFTVDFTVVPIFVATSSC